MQVFDLTKQGNEPLLLSKFVERFAPSQEVETSEDSAIALVDKLECAFEPIYRYDGSQFGLSGHRAVSTSSFSADDISSYLNRALNSGPLSVRDVMGMGVCQLSMLEKHLENFASQYQPNDTLHLEIDIADIDENIAKLQHLQRLITLAGKQGLPPSTFVLELSAAPYLDIGVLYSVTAQLKQLGVQVSLTDIDADCFSLNRIFVAAPNSVRFNRSWCHFGRDNSAYLRFVTNTLGSLREMGVAPGIAKLECEDDVVFAVRAGFYDYSGLALSQPAVSMSRHSIEFFSDQQPQLAERA